MNGLECFLYFCSGVNILELNLLDEIVVEVNKGVFYLINVADKAFLVLSNFLNC